MRPTTFRAAVATVSIGLVLLMAAPMRAQSQGVVVPGPFLVFFEPNSSALSAESKKILNAAIEVYRTRLPPGTPVKVEGHTDTVGSKESNRALSVARANEVKAYFVKAGIPAASITAAGFGEDTLLVQTPDETPDPQNNRVEISFEWFPQ